MKNVGVLYLLLDPEQDKSPLPAEAEELIEIQRLPMVKVRDLVLRGEMSLVSAQTFWMACDWLQEHGYDLKKESISSDTGRCQCQ